MNDAAGAMLELPPGLLEAARVTPAELKLELALTLFQQDKLSFGKARELAGLLAIDFQRELGRREIPIHYGVADFEQDMATLKTMGML
jgi:predicted HTH domain antitoxin